MTDSPQPPGSTPDVCQNVRGAITLRRERVEMADVVMRAIEMTSGPLQASGHRLELDVDPDGLGVDVDPACLAQVIADLLNRAASQAEPGRAIVVVATRDRDTVVLRVRDRDAGEADARPFEPHAPGDRTVDKTRGGHPPEGGPARDLVQLQGGTMDERSNASDRDAFVIRLPWVALLAPPLPAPAPPALPVVGHPARVLVVDDNEDAAEMLVESLSEGGFQARAVHDGPTALALCPSFLPEVALIDIGLPVMDGYEVARQLRRLPGLESVPLVAITGYSQDSDRRRTTDAGFNVHLTKPIHLATLLRTVAGLCPAPREPPPGRQPAQNRAT